MIDKKLLEKVQKLLKLSENNPSQEEAQSAMLKAQEFMAKHGIEMSTVQNIGENVKKEVVDTAVTNSGRTEWWHKQLLKVIGDNFRCQPYLGKLYGGATSCNFIGLKEDVELAKAVFQYAVTTIEYCSNRYIENIFRVKFKVLNKRTPTKGEVNANKNDYIKGFIAGLQKKFEEQVEQNNWGLVLVKDSLVIKAVEEKHLVRSKGSKVRSGGNREAFNSGFERGKSFDHNTKALK